MNRIRRIGAAVATLAGALLALITASAAYASVPPHGGGPAGAPTASAPSYGRYPPPGQLSKYEPVAHHFNGVTGGVTGWQIALIAVGAAIVGAIMALLIDRARAARRRRPATA